ncbi:MAG: ABC transporter permease, partial [Rhodobacteraceae bacterium]|nr:ABC transporter permease [Paracoccaceae bacterium]
MTDPHVQTPAVEARAPEIEDEQGVREASGANKPARSQWWDVWDQFKNHRGAMGGMIVFCIIFFLIIVGPFIYWNDATFVPTGRDFLELRDTRPIYTALYDSSAKVNWAHPLGTDNLGRDTLARLLSGGRVSIAVGMAAMVLSIVIGTLVGVLAGYIRWLDGPLMRLTDLFLALPLLPLLLVAVLLFREPLSAAFGP